MTLLLVVAGLIFWSIACAGVVLLCRAAALADGGVPADPPRRVRTRRRRTALTSARRAPLT